MTRKTFTAPGFSALQRAEIAEIERSRRLSYIRSSFSALQRAEIAEIPRDLINENRQQRVSVLFNEPKLLKSGTGTAQIAIEICFSALQRAEIAEIFRNRWTK